MTFVFRLCVKNRAALNSNFYLLFYHSSSIDSLCCSIVVSIKYIYEEKISKIIGHINKVVGFRGVSKEIRYVFVWAKTVDILFTTTLGTVCKMQYNCSFVYNEAL